MPRWSIAYVRFVDRLCERVGKVALYLLYVMMAIMLWSVVTKYMRFPAIWTLEMSQFTLIAYFMLGAPWTLRMDTNVRMDLLYARWSPKRQALWDAFTVVALMVYLAIMLYGAFDSTVYSFTHNERNPTAWRPVLWPLKSVVTFAFALMLLQSTAILIRDIATVRGEKI